MVLTNFTSNKRILAGEIHDILSGECRHFTSKELSELTGRTVREVVGALMMLDAEGAVCKVEGQKCALWSTPGTAGMPRKSVYTSEKGECRVRVIRLMERTDHPLSRAEIAEGIGADLHMVSAILASLRRDGKVARHGQNPPVWERVR